MRLGIDLGGTKIAAAVLDEAGTQVLERRTATPVGDYSAIIAALGDMVRTVEGELGERLSVGVGVPGSIDPGSGRIKNANAVALNDRTLESDLTDALGRQVQVANDADCFALSEAVDGAGTDEHVVFGAIIGTGVGGGIVVDRSLLGGPNAITGEWGHIPLPWAGEDERPGPACFCGRFGCVEMFIAGPGLEAAYRMRSGRAADAPRVAELADAGDGDAKASLLRHADQVARSLAAVINVLDPDVVVLGGGVSNFDHLYTAVPELWDRYVFSDAVRTRLVPAKHGDDSGVRGAAWLGRSPSAT